jgi:hypothetical protein
MGISQQGEDLENWQGNTIFSDTYRRTCAQKAGEA